MPLLDRCNGTAARVFNGSRQLDPTLVGTSGGRRSPKNSRFFLTLQPFLDEIIFALQSPSYR